MDEHEIYMKVRKALELFFLQDHELLERGVNERSISHKIAEHLQYVFRGYDVDCEYNRHGVEIKRAGKKKRVFPDIVVHQRGSDEANILVLEVKKVNSKYYKNDVEKLKVLTGRQFRYKSGLLLVFNTEGKLLSSVRCFQNGVEREKNIWGNLIEQKHDV